ncbi:hypothetical protein LCGC14_2933400 [marine sediment metagenome]|uniref:Uncharacterized protein n=1 Tax=marine sediment metagenome TaxID=412755 RepID=A0A0F9AB89_9ZZZZ
MLDSGQGSVTTDDGAAKPSVEGVGIIIGEATAAGIGRHAHHQVSMLQDRAHNSDAIAHHCIRGSVS